MGPKAKPAQPRALPHGKKDGPRHTPKNVALLLVSSKVTLLDSFSSFQIFRELQANGPYALAIHHKVVGY